MAEQDVITSEKPAMSAEQLVVHDTSEYAMLFDSAKFNQAYRVATAFAKSGLVPDHFKENPAGVFVVLHMATRMQLDPFMALQKVYMVHGRPGMEAQLVIALVNARGPFTGPIQWRFEGEGKTRKCTAYATHAKTGELCEATVTWGMVEAEGWNEKKGSKWLTIPDLMFRYRSATFLARLYCPEVILGLSTTDELEDSIITLDSGVEISKRPQASIPETPTSDPETIAQFDTLFAAKNHTQEQTDLLPKFLAVYPGMTPEEIKSRAVVDFEGKETSFWPVFTAWCEKHGKKKPGRPPKSPESPQGEPNPEAKAEGQGVKQEGGTSHPRGIAADTVKAIEKAMEASGLSLETPYFRLGIAPTMPVAELTENDGQAILDWFKTQ